MPQVFMTAVLGKRGQGEGEVLELRLQPTFQTAVSISMSLQPSMESVRIYQSVLHTEIQIAAKQHFLDFKLNLE